MNPSYIDEAQAAQDAFDAAASRLADAQASVTNDSHICLYDAKEAVEAEIRTCNQTSGNLQTSLSSA